MCFLLPLEFFVNGSVPSLLFLFPFKCFVDDLKASLMLSFNSFVDDLRASLLLLVDSFVEVLNRRMDYRILEDVVHLMEDADILEVFD